MADIPNFLVAPPWTDQDLILYHGTHSLFAKAIRAGIDVTLGNPRADFGRGFYTTTVRRQARAWAVRRSAVYELTNPDPSRPPQPVVLRFRIPRSEFAGLETLVFVRGDHQAEDYWSFVQHCRRGGAGHGRPMIAGRGGWYDVVAGPVAAAWESRMAFASADQISFHTPRGATLLGRSLAGIERAA